jgi:Icc-related predicted phosphoesterase
MKIHYVSDLHLECEYQELPGGEVLILAGDIAEVTGIAKSHHSTKLVQDTPDHFYRLSEFFKWECAKYDRVFYVMGNHEHYSGRLDKSYHILKSIMPDNVFLLENEVVEYNGVMFMGATMWTDMNKNDPITLQIVKNDMNDYRSIKNYYANKDLYYRLTPEHTVGMFRKTVEYFKQTLESEENLTKPFVVITHHSPSYASINDKYKSEYYMNGAYCSDLSNFILDHPQIKYWIHGHLHDAVDYMIGSTHITSNPRGYTSFEDTSNFNPTKSFEL